MPNNVDINLTARTRDFETGLTKANELFNKLATTGGDVNNKLKTSFKEISGAAKNTSDEFQKMMNIFNVKSDIEIKVDLSHIKNAETAYSNLFNTIRKDAKLSEGEITAMSRSLQMMQANANSHLTSGNFKTLGVSSQSSIEAEKLKVISAFEEINRIGFKSDNERIRSHEAMTAQIERLDSLLVTSAEKAAMQKVTVEREAAAQKIAIAEKEIIVKEQMLNQLRAASVNAEVQSILAAEKAAAAKVAAEQEAAKKIVIAHEQALRMDKEISIAKQATVDAELRRMSLLHQEALKMEASRVAADREAIAQINIAHEQALRMDKERNAQMVANREAALRKMTLAHVDAIKMNDAFNKKLTDNTGELVQSTAKATQGVNLLGLASIATILKIQILYSLVNSTMSAIASIPRIAVDAIETFNASIVKNAATITSMSGNIKDIGKSYQENKVYAEAVQRVLVKMDSTTIASYKQLQLMNDAFVQQGVFIDINNKKQVDGYRNVANALATITAGMQNPDMQFTQEIKALMLGEDRTTNQLFKTLKAIDPELKEHMKSWQQIARETGNAGYVLEKLSPLLVGFAAASGDIDSLWTTVSSTLKTIRDDVLRGGLQQGFGEIVLAMKEMAKYATENKEKIQAFLRDGFANAKVAAEYMWNLAKAVSYFGEPLKYGAVVLGFTAIANAIGKVNIALLATPIGKINALIGVMGAIATYGIGKTLDSKSADLDINEIKSSVPDPGALRKGLAKASSYTSLTKNLDQGALGQIKNRFPMMDNQTIASLIRNKGIVIEEMVDEEYARIYGKVNFNEAQIKFLLASQIASVKIPKPPKGGKDETDSEKAAKYSRSNDLLLANIKEYARLMEEQEKSFYTLGQEITRTADAEVRFFDLQNKIVGDLTTNRYAQGKTDRSIGSLLKNGGEYDPLGARYHNNVTKLSDYRIGGANYGIKQSRITPEQQESADLKIKGIGEGLTSKLESLNGDDYGSKMAAIEKQHTRQLEELENYKKMEGSIIEKYNAEKLKSDEVYAKSKEQLDKRTWQEGIANIGQSMAQVASVMMKGNKEQFEAGKAMAIAAAMIQVFSAEVAVFAGITSSTGGWGIAAAIAEAAAVGAIGMATIAQIESTQYQGRALGGPVVAGQTYVVNENRKSEGPEYFTPGVSGTLTPASKMGSGGSSSVTQVIQVSTGVTDTVRSEMGRMYPMFKELAVSAVKQAQREGRLAA